MYPIFLRHRNFPCYVLTLAGLAILGIVLFASLFPLWYSVFLSNALKFFCADIQWQTIQEGGTWTFVKAWHVFNYSLILFAGGIIVLLHKFRKEVYPSYIFILIWTLLILYATSQHSRYEYYLAVPIAILSAITIGSAINMVFPVKLSHPEESVLPSHPIHSDNIPREEKDTQQIVPSQLSIQKVRGLIIFVFIAVMGILFAINAVGDDLSISTSKLNNDWWESCTWLEE